MKKQNGGAVQIKRIHLHGVAHAKVNLALHIIRKQDNGYHEIQSLVAFTQFGDEISLCLNEESTLHITGTFKDLIPGIHNNLISKGLHLFSSRSESGFAVKLEKQIPVCAGLGGGSSDAAKAIQLASKLLSCPLPTTQQLVSVGADVPVCMSSQPCLVSGIGDKIKPIVNIPALPLILVNPNINLATGPVFQSLTTVNNSKFSLLPNSWSFNELISWLTCQRNDLEESAFRLCPTIKDVLRAIKHTQGCLMARMTGSGPTCYGIYETNDIAVQAAHILSENHPDWWVRATHTLSA